MKVLRAHRDDGAGRRALPPANPEDLADLFAAPRWLRDLGRTSWLLVGFLLLGAGLMWLLAATYTIVGPVVGAAIVAVVTMPVVRALQARRLPRPAAAAIVLLLLAATAVVVVVVVIAAISGQADSIASQLSHAVDRVQGWLKDMGVDESGAQGAGDQVKADAPAILSTLTTGIVTGIKGIASLAFGLSFAVLSLFFLLKDGPMMRAWVDRHLGVPVPVAQTITGNVVTSLRGYFRGTTLVGAFNGVVVALGALVLGVPLAGTIGVVTFITAYVPYLGAFVAGVFTFAIALGAKGTTTAVIMLLVFLLANGMLQQLVQPFAMGAALQLNPLVVLIVTVGAGCLFGTIGLILAAPLLSAAVHISGDLRASAASPQPASPEPEPPPIGVSTEPAGRP
ncbi:MAG TPA: AI-2E family transporter [Gaiellaceae bacterium]